MKTKNILKLYSLSAVAVTVIITVLRVLTLLKSYDVSTGYFNPSSITLITNAVSVLAVLGCLSALFLIPKGTITANFTAENPAVRLASAYSAIITLLASVAMLTSSSAGALEKSAVVFSFLSTIFFVFSAISKGIFDTAKAFSAISVIASHICILASLYFDLTIAMNSPHKIYGSFALMAAMLLMLFETRIYLGKPMPRTHFTFAMLSLILGFSQSASVLIYRLASDISEFEAMPVLLGNTGYVILIAAISIFAAARCFTFRVAEIVTDSPESENVT